MAYGFYNFNHSENKILLSVGGFLFLALTLVFTIGANFDLPRTTINIRTVSAVFFIVSLASNVTFSFFSFSTPNYVIINGILLMIYALIVYSISRARQ